MNPTPPPVRQNDEESGLTLVELLVTMILGLLVLTTVGMIVISTTSIETSVASVSSATEAGQLAVESLQTGIRNSEVSFDPAQTASLASPTFELSAVGSGDQLLVALVVGNGPGFSESCEAWYYSASARTLQFTTSTSAITAPDANASAGWHLLAVGVSPTAGQQVFTELENPSSPASVALSFTLDISRGIPPEFHTVVGSRTNAIDSRLACY